MSRDKSLTIWKRKKSEVETRIYKLESLRKESIAWLRNASENRVELLWRRKDYLNFIQKQDRLDVVIRDTATKLGLAKQELVEITRHIQQLEQGRMKTIPLLATLGIMLILGLGILFTGVDSGSGITGLVVSETISESIGIQSGTDNCHEKISCLNETITTCSNEIVQKCDLACVNETKQVCSEQCKPECHKEKINGIEREVCAKKCSETCTEEMAQNCGSCADIVEERCTSEIVERCSTKTVCKESTENSNIDGAMTANIVQEVEEVRILPIEEETPEPSTEKLTQSKTANDPNHLIISMIDTLAKGTDYMLQMFTFSLQGGKAGGATYEARTLTYTSSGISNSAGSLFTANIGFFNQTVIAVANTAPVVNFVAAVSPQSVSEGTTALFAFKFNVTDADGWQTINNNSATVRINYTGVPDNYNTSNNVTCSPFLQTSSTSIAFNCNVTVWYFAQAANWTINASINDTSGVYAENITTTFQIQSTTAMNMYPTALTWATLELGTTNQTSNNDPLIINNTGNTDIAVGGITVAGYNLQGTSITTDFINAENFSISAVNFTGSGGPMECNGTQMFNGTSGAAAPQAIFAANITRGNNSINTNNQASGQEELFVCLRTVPLGITRQTYNTAGLSSKVWTVAVS